MADICTVPTCGESARGRYCRRHWRASEKWMAEQRRLDAYAVEGLDAVATSLDWAEWDWNAPSSLMPQEFGDLTGLDKLA